LVEALKGLYAGLFYKYYISYDFDKEEEMNVFGPTKENI
jgi:hypothetical protein